MTRSIPGIDPSQPGDEVVAAWLRQAPDAVVSRESALETLGAGDVIADRVNLTVPRPDP